MNILNRLKNLLINCSYYNKLNFLFCTLLLYSTFIQNKPLPHSHWRHYKSTGGTDHTYEVIGIAKHSETEEEMVVYRPLYTVTEDSWVYGYDFAVRPLSMWYEIVEWNDKQVQRFTQI